MNEKRLPSSKQDGGTLYLVATPIGNLGDISARAAATLASVDFIAAEDTRVSAKLLNHLQIKKNLISYHEHNRAESGEKIVARLLAGESCALVTDAGMPAISDPGQELVKLCADAGIPVLAIPGASAVVCAVALSGLPSGRWMFEGFLSTAKKSRFAHLDELKTEKRTMVFYEAPHKLRRTLADMLEVLGDRRVALSRELTKIHEETVRTTLAAAVTYYETTEPRGEFVLVIEGYVEPPSEKPTLGDALNAVKKLTETGKSLKDAVKQVSAELGIAKNALYEAAVARSGD
ncbi:MAG: 16S rRNA (cytidine(1402)-2'-O)-methyltransferase [Oscillospiraceae bacterium]|jgi:16S rRNA (cytidine1402-2'-O)-methyltransferase|nr:16S rRNA (cytidine(1402)-2'-O)-methyltransferase [Oscillospiraceae bacterium]